MLHINHLFSHKESCKEKSQWTEINRDNRRQKKTAAQGQVHLFTGVSQEDTIGGWLNSQSEWVWNLASAGP